MTFKEVKLKAIDEKSGLRFPCRSLDIIFSGATVSTPSRAATSSEYNFKDKAGTKREQGQISYYLKKLNYNHLENYLTKNEVAATVYSEVENFNERMKFSPFHFNIIQPTTSKIRKREPEKDIDSGIDLLLNNPKERENFLKMIIEMQSRIAGDIVTLTPKTSFAKKGR